MKMGSAKAAAGSLLPFLVMFSRHWLTSFALVPPGTKQYCQFDPFKAECNDDEVILMLNAKYGRMRSGRCMSGEGYIGCSTDVTSYMDTQCSGRRKCEVSVTSIANVVQPCRRDFISYLEASFKCVKVSKGDSSRCHLQKFIELTSPAGFLASLTTVEQNIGTVMCPWQITVQRGQQISLQLSVYGHKLPESPGGQETGERGQKCSYNVVIEEDSTFTSEGLCGNRRDTHLYTSQTNSIQVYLNYAAKQDIPAYGIKYKVVGCPDIKELSTATVTRTGDDLVIRCNKTRETWYLTCKHGKWVGEMGNCSSADGSAWGLKTVMGAPIPFPQGLIIAIILGVVLGIVIGTISLGVLLFVRKRRLTRAARAAAMTDPMLRTPDSDKSSTGHRKTGTGTGRSYSGSKSQLSSSGYYSGDTMRSSSMYPHSVADYTGGRGGGGGGGAHTGPGYARRSHVYETPRLPEEMGSDGKVYFELDPSEERRDLHMIPHLT